MASKTKAKPKETTTQNEKAAGKYSITATCKCEASVTKTSNDKEFATSQAISKIPHKDGCNVDLAAWQAWITVQET